MELSKYDEAVENASSESNEENADNLEIGDDQNREDDFQENLV